MSDAKPILPAAPEPKAKAPRQKQSNTFSVTFGQAMADKIRAAAKEADESAGAMIATIFEDNASSDIVAEYLEAVRSIAERKIQARKGGGGG